MRIISRNVNGIRSILKKGFIERIKLESPDILCLQEVKAFENQIPIEIKFGFQDYNYVRHRSERAGYAGTAIFYKKNIEITSKDNIFNHPTCFNDDGRVTSISRGDYVLLNIYFPNGGPKADGTPMLGYKINFYKEYQNYVKGLIDKGKKVITTGDFNICHHPIDIARPKENENSIGFLLEERAEMDNMEKIGLIDVFRYQNPDLANKYTWRSYRAGARQRNVGWRLDYFRISENMKNNIGTITHHDQIQGSDHCPISIEIK